MKPNLFTWGLAPDTIAAISKRIAEASIHHLQALPQEMPQGLLLIAANALPEYVAWAQKVERTTGECPYPVLLFLPTGKGESSGYWNYYEDVVTLENIEILEQMIRSPGIAEAELAAADVPSIFLKSLKLPVSAIPMARIPFDSADWNAPESEMRRMLTETSDCRKAFNAALEWRMSVAGTILSAAQQLFLEVAIAEVKQQGNLRTAALIGVLAAFLQVHEMSVRRRATQPLRSAARGGKDITDITRRLLLGTTEADISVLLEQLAAGLVLESHDIEFELTLDQETLVFDEIKDRSDNLIEHYQIELRNGEKDPWRIPAVHGRVVLPLSELEQFLDAQPVHFVIQQLAKEA